MQINNVDNNKANPHDGTRGRWTFIPAEDRILVKDEVKGKVYSLLMEEIEAEKFINDGGNVNMRGNNNGVL